MIQRFFLPHPSRRIQGIDFALRLWLGYTMVSNAPVGVTIPLESIGLDPDSYAFLKSLWDTGYLMHATKVIELLAGLALLTNRFTALALVLLMPVLINIVGITAHFFPGGLPRNGALLGAAIVLLFLRKKQFQPLFQEPSFYEKSLRDGRNTPGSHQNDPALSGALP
jgi:uncharacterized membrane protein YphA (DoxX/SURF4 family)